MHSASLRSRSQVVIRRVLTIVVVFLGYDVSARDIDLPHDFPNVQIEASVGQWILCPSKELLIHSIERTGTLQSFSFYPAKLKEVGPYSRVETTDHRIEVLPNYVVVPIASGQTAAPGQIVLTWWQPKSAMNRAIVVEGGSRQKPVVRYLDVKTNHASGAGTKDHQLNEDTFHVLGKPWQPGTMISFPATNENRNKQFDYTYGQIISVAGDILLIHEYGGILSVQHKHRAIVIPIHPEVSVHDNVWVAYRGRIRKADATRVDDRNGIVVGKIETDGESVLVEVPYGNILSKPPTIDMITQDEIRQ